MTDHKNIGISLLSNDSSDVVFHQAAGLLSEQMDSNGKPRPGREVFNALRHAIAESNTRVFIAKDAAGDIVGIIFSNIGHSIEKAGRYLWINELHVSRAVRRKGVARQLLLYVMDWCRSEKIAGISLSATIDNIGASQLYNQAGFESEKVNMFNLLLSE